MKKAVITSGGKQYIVSEGDQVEVELVKGESKKIDFVPLLLIEDQKIYIGRPELAKAKVTADILESDIKTDKVVAIRYKAKKRVKTVHGHRQHKSLLKIKTISSPVTSPSTK